MLIKEYRIPLPLTVEEYRIAQLYMIAKKSRQESRGADSGSGVEILVNEPYNSGPGGEGQYTHKVYHVGSHLPGWFKSLLPKSALTVEEKAWNAYPYTKTQFSCPFVEKFSLEIETYYTPDGGHLENVFNLPDSELRNRIVDHIDVVRDQDASYVAEEDPTLYVSQKTGRGPLSEDWVQAYSQECVGKPMPSPSGKSIMCAYKLCKVEFRYWGMQSKIERFIHDMALRNTMLKAHKQAWVWQDEWAGLTMEDIRKIEKETAAELARTMRGEDVPVGDEDSGSLPSSEAHQDIEISLRSIEYSSLEAPNIIPKGSEMLPRRSICLEEEDDEAEGVRTAVVNGQLAREEQQMRGGAGGGGGAQAKLSVGKSIARSGISSDRLSRFSFTDPNPIETLGRSNSEFGESEDEFYDCSENPDDIRSLTKWNSLELVPDADGEMCESAPVGPTKPIFTHSELRRTVSHYAESGQSYRPGRVKHPTIELAEIARERDVSVEPSCRTTILILVVHGGSVLDPVTELAVRKSDVTTLRGAFESIMRQHYPALVGHLVIRCVPCPSICSEALAILSSLNPYSFDLGSGVSNDRLPIGAIPLLATASPRYQEALSQLVATANATYRHFLATDEGAGFAGQVCLVGDSIGSILAYDALCRSMKRSSSDSSVPESTATGGGGASEPLPRDSSPPSPRLSCARADSPRIVTDHYHHSYQHQQNSNRLSAQSLGSRHHSGEETPRECLHFDVTDFFICGSPIGLLLAYRKVFSGLDSRGPHSPIPRPNCHQVYNLFHPANPVAARLEPLLSAHFAPLPPVNIPRYQKYPMGDGQSLSILELVQSNPGIFSEGLRLSFGAQQPPPTPGRARRPSSESIVSGMFDTQQMHAMAVMKAKWWGSKRVDYALYCPEGLANFPTNSLPHLFHSSYWESADVISFILRQLISQNSQLCVVDIDRDLKSFTPNQAREKWMKKRTSVKIRNGAANHRGNDVLVLEGKEQVLQGKFSYGPLDMAGLSWEKVDIHIMKEPPSGEWTHLATELTDKSGRVTYRIPPSANIGYGVFPVKMVVRGDHTVLDLHLVVVPPKTEAVVFSIDGSFTASVSVTGKDPKVRAGAVDVVRHWQDLGYLIIYVTGRPCMQLRKVVSWLSMHNFPYGVVSFADGITTDPLRHKTEYLKGLQTEHEMLIHAAYGSSKDISVYSSLGLRPENIHVVGKISKKQQGSCNNITDGYAGHLGYLTSPGGSRPAEGNARMVVPRASFGLPGQFSLMRRQTVYRMSGKKLAAATLPPHHHHSLPAMPASAPPIHSK